MIIKEEILNDPEYDQLKVWAGFSDFLDQVEINKNQLYFLKEVLIAFLYEVDDYVAKSSGDQLKQGFLFRNLLNLNATISHKEFIANILRSENNGIPKANVHNLFSHIAALIKGDKLTEYLAKLGGVEGQIIPHAKLLLRRVIQSHYNKLTKGISESEVSLIIKKYDDFLSSLPRSDSSDSIPKIDETFMQNILQTVINSLSPLITTIVDHISIHQNFDVYRNLPGTDQNFTSADTNFLSWMDKLRSIAPKLHIYIAEANKALAKTPDLLLKVPAHKEILENLFGGFLQIYARIQRC